MLCQTSPQTSGGASALARFVVLRKASSASGQVQALSSVRGGSMPAAPTKRSVTARPLEGAAAAGEGDAAGEAAGDAAGDGAGEAAGEATAAGEAAVGGAAGGDGAAAGEAGAGAAGAGAGGAGWQA